MRRDIHVHEVPPEIVPDWLHDYRAFEHPAKPPPISRMWIAAMIASVALLAWALAVRWLG